MKLERKIELLKFCFAVLNSVFLVLGLSVLGCGVWILFDTGSFLNVLSSEELRVVAAGLFMIGGVVALVSLAGCAAATMEKRFLLLVYFGFLIVLVLGQLYVTVLLLLDRDKIDTSLTQAVDEIISQYGNSSSSGSRIMDSIQRSTECCGRTGPHDWLKNSFIQTLGLTSPDVLPCSCFRSFPLNLNSSWCSGNLSFTGPWIANGTGAFNQSCSQKINQWLQENVLTIVAMDAVLILIQIIELSIAGSLFHTFGEKYALKKTKRLVEEDAADSDAADSDFSSELDPDGGEQNYAFIDPDGGATGYMTAGDVNNMAYDLYNQNQGYQEPLQYHQNQNQGYQEPLQYHQNQNQEYQEPLQHHQNQGYQEAVQHY